MSASPIDLGSVAFTNWDRALLASSALEIWPEVSSELIGMLDSVSFVADNSQGCGYCRGL